ncbi:MAG: exosome complex RNA-binding protein Csl4 [Thermoproteota archaeon]
MENNKLVTPGEGIVPIEVAQTGHNAFEHEGTIISCVIGRPVFDKEKRVLSVEAVKELLVPRPGSEVMGRVARVQDTFAVVDILLIDKEISRSNFVGLLHISRVSRRRTKNMVDALKVGDLIVAKVVAVNNGSVHLSTSDSSEGVFLGYCSRCGGVLKQISRGRLVCQSCGARESRKISSEYGRFEVWGDHERKDFKEK